MNILLYDMGSYTQKDLIYYLEKAGHHCQNILYKFQNVYTDDFFEYYFSQYLEESPWDCVISTNFFPLVAKLCYQKNMKYISWVYDSPIDADPIFYYQYPTNYIFLFDRLEAERIKKLGGVHIYHLPLGINVERTNQLTISEHDRQLYSADISFIGQFYTSPLPQLMSCQEEYDKGYIDAIVQSQLQVYGCNFIEELISDELLARMNRHLQITPPLTKNGLVHSIAKHITHTERLVLCNLLGQLYNFVYYSTEQPPSLSHLTYGGTAYYFTEMPKIFRLSKLNLNPTLKSIQSGIPLRALDILGNRGVLFSNYQPELVEYFVDGEDVILYESIEDALCKAEFYLQHEDLLTQIAQNGYQKVATFFTYPNKIEYILKTAGLL